ncbi:right-handed parallel beta-helix repeat-containing protein [Methanococcus maripaludis]|uniref:Periplasmic copper-binding protein NosD beta helix domain-containing protein n=1 Tax=Methanococcus maripaludis TaxID=39152 RepID=A0A7J9RWG8_METMI|nr:NosD domain-containing protein [Methanococcus maripaludis]MBB6066555.1 hypothetical protein [Methanococcus maripaludis]
MELDPIDYNQINNSNYDTARNITSPGMYYLTENISNTNGIIISSDNVTLDGKGYFLNITGNCGVNSTKHNNITVKNVKITTTSYSGIYFKNVNFPTVENNTINTTYLCSLWGSGYNFTVVNNSMSSGFGGNYGLEQLTTYKVVGNTINGKPIYFYKNEENIGEIPSDASQIIISNCTNGQIKNLTLDENAVVIYIGDSSEITVKNCTIKPNIYHDYDIYLINSENCNVTNNTFGISENTNFGVIKSYYSNNITISENTLNGMAMGFVFYKVTNSNIFENTFENVYGVSIGEQGGVSDVYVYTNNFINSTRMDVENITFNSPANVSYLYNGAVYSGIAGNYWNDYSEPEAIINNGIWSIPYSINELVNDSYPLVKEKPEDGKIHLTQSDFDSETGYIINKSGTYVLDEDITCDMGIRINANDVMINGWRHCLIGTGFNMSAGIYTLNGTYENIEIKNILLTNWTVGISAPYFFTNESTNKTVSNLAVLDCTFECGNISIFSALCEDITIDSCKFTNATIGDDLFGACTLLQDSNADITNCTFKFNNIGIFSGLNDNITIDSCKFTNSTSGEEIPFGIGMASAQDFNADITNCTFESNSIGAVSQGCENTKIDSCEFINNTIGEGPFGIGILMQNFNADITNCTFEYNERGAILKGEYITTDSCEFINNTVGLIPAMFYNGTVTGCTFENNNYGITTSDEFVGEATEVQENTISQNNFIENGCGLYLGGVNNWVYLNRFENNSQNINFISLFGNYFQSPEVTYEYEGETYKGRLGNYYGEELGTSNTGIFDKPYGIEGMLLRK